MLAFDALQEMERIDVLLNDYRDVLAAVRPRQDADALNRDYSDAITRLRYDPDAPPIHEWRQADVMAAAEQIMKGIKWRTSNPPVS